MSPGSSACWERAPPQPHPYSQDLNFLMPPEHVPSALSQCLELQVWTLWCPGGAGWSPDLGYSRVGSSLNSVLWTLITRYSRGCLPLRTRVLPVHLSHPLAFSEARKWQGGTAISTPHRNSLLCLASRLCCRSWTVWSWCLVIQNAKFPCLFLSFLKEVKCSFFFFPSPLYFHFKLTWNVLSGCWIWALAVHERALTYVLMLEPHCGSQSWSQNALGTRG